MMVELSKNYLMLKDKETGFAYFKSALNLLLS